MYRSTSSVSSNSCVPGCQGRAHRGRRCSRRQRWPGSVGPAAARSQAMARGWPELPLAGSAAARLFAPYLDRRAQLLRRHLPAPVGVAPECHKRVQGVGLGALFACRRCLVLQDDLTELRVMGGVARGQRAQVCHGPCLRAASCMLQGRAHVEVFRTRMLHAFMFQLHAWGPTHLRKLDLPTAVLVNVVDLGWGVAWCQG
jgi:hypothetical protein